MKNTKMRKKMLLSSIAMLMVASVSLGSATYAWFMQNPNANASGLVMKASASKGLVILTESHKATITGEEIDPAKHFKTSDYLNYDKNTETSSRTSFVLSPASMDVTAGEAVGTAYTTTASTNTAYGASDTADVTSVQKGYANKPVYKESIFCALTGATSDADVAELSLAKLSVKFNTNASILKRAIRVVVAYEADGSTEKVLGTYALANKNSESASNKMLTGNIVDGTKYGLVNPANTGTLRTTMLTQDTETTSKFNYVPTGNDGLLGNIGQDGKDKVNVYVYLDGEDENCYSQVINASDLIDEVTVDLKIPTT